MSARRAVDDFAHGCANLTRIEEELGFAMSAVVFNRVLVDFVGYADYGSCHLMEWVIDQYSATPDCGARFCGRLVVSPEEVAVNLNVPQEVVADFARRIHKAGLATFHKTGSSWWVEVHWDMVESVAWSRSEEILKS